MKRKTLNRGNGRINPAGEPLSGVRQAVMRSGSENDANNVWNVNFNGGDVNNDNKDNGGSARAVRAPFNTNLQLSLFSDEELGLMTYPALEQAWIACKVGKGRSSSAKAFEVGAEEALHVLLLEINNGTYTPQPYSAFVVRKPVTREIFAAAFRDRIVHHYIIGRLNPLFEKAFIYDSYACRKGKGTLFGIRRVERFVRQCSASYSRDAYILKLDVQSFFTSIDKQVLWNRLQPFVSEKYQGYDNPLVLKLCKQLISHNPVENCSIKGKISDWNLLPANKSLLLQNSTIFDNSQFSILNSQLKGLPIGNLTSQEFANFYMNAFDHFVKHDLGIRYYGRYVDDFIIVHNDKQYLKSLVPAIENFLETELKLTLHPKKRYLQHYSKGVSFLGAFILPYRSYLGKRSKSNFYRCIGECNQLVRTRKPVNKEIDKAQARINSYLGIMKHYNTRNLRKKMLGNRLSGYWFNHLYISGGYRKVVRKWKYKIRKQNNNQLNSNNYG